MITKDFAISGQAEIRLLEKGIQSLKSRFAANVVQAARVPPARVKFTSRELKLEKQLGRVLALLDEAHQTLSEIEKVEPK
jgi:hypothetical protein